MTDSRIYITGITGGIGAGKSIVSRLLRLKGYFVYDCDYDAKRLMNSDAGLQNTLRNVFGSDIIQLSGNIDRAALGALVFSKPELLEKLNSIVHPAVKNDLLLWAANHAKSQQPLFVESAILASSGISDCCNDVWYVDAPQEARIRRVKARNSLDEETVKKRIKAQEKETERLCDADLRIYSFSNDKETSLLDSVNRLLENFNQQYNQC